MRAILINFIASACAAGALAAEPSYDPDVTAWEEVVRPPKTDAGARAVWDYAANFSRLEWQVFFNAGEPRARLTEKSPPEPSDKPEFVPKAGRLRKVPDFLRVDHGWLVGFNQGEFGAALYWFSADGKHSYRISDHQVVRFFTLPTGIYAIEVSPIWARTTGQSFASVKSPRHIGKQAQSLSFHLLRSLALCVEMEQSLLPFATLW